MVVEVSGRDPCRLLIRNSRDAAWPIARFLFDESRRTCPENLLPTCIRNLEPHGQVEPSFLFVHRRLRRIHSGGRRRRNDQYWDAVCIHACLRRSLDPAHLATRICERAFRVAGGAGCFHARHHRLRRDDLWSRLDELDAVACLACDWTSSFTLATAFTTPNSAAENRRRDRVVPCAENCRGDLAVFGSLGSILWLARYRTEYIPGPLGIVIGLAGFVLAWSLGALLNLVAQVSDHTHARHLMMESPASAET